MQSNNIGVTSVHVSKSFPFCRLGGNNAYMSQAHRVDKLLAASGFSPDKYSNPLMKS